jgi:hypothetical protein
MTENPTMLDNRDRRRDFGERDQVVDLIKGGEPCPA